MDKQKRNKNHDSLDEVIYSDDGKKEVFRKDALVEEKDYFEEYINSEIYPIIREIVMELPANEKEIIMLSFGFYDDKIYTQQEIADKLSITQSYVSKLLTKIVKKIGYQLEEKGIIEICNRNEEVKKR